MRFTPLILAAAASVSYAQNLDSLLGDLATNTEILGLASSLVTDPALQSLASELATATDFGSGILTNSIFQSLTSAVGTNSVIQSLSSAIATNSDLSSLVAEATGSGASETSSGSNPVSTQGSGAERVVMGAAGAAAAGVFGLAALL